MPKRPVPVLALIALAILPIVLVPLSPLSTPWHANNAQLSVVSDAAIFGVVAVATGMFAYLTGLPSIAQAGLWGLGAYAAAISLNHLHISFWLSFVFAVAVPVIVAWPAGVVSLRTRGMAFLIVTLAFSEFVILVLENATSLTGGFSGLGYTDDPSPIGPFHFDTTVQQYYLYLFVLFVALFIYWLIRRSSFGRRVTAVRDNSDLARSLSINANLHRLIMFELSAAVTGLAGPLILIQQRVITPDFFNTDEFLSVYLMIMLGGIATIAGPAVGAWVVELLPQWLSGFAVISPNAQELIYGILLIFFVLVARQGVVGQASTLYAYATSRFGAGRRAATAADTDPGPSHAEPSAPTEGRARTDDIFGDREPRELSPDVVLTTSHLSHHFGANRVLNDLEFDLRVGEVRGLVGPNGSGKTTMLNCVSGFLRPAEGEVVFRGQSVVGRRFEKISSLGLVRTFQQPEVFASFTARDTCEMVLASVGALGGGREINTGLPDDASYFLDLCALTDVADVSSLVLPYGQTRLLGIAAALSRRPFTLMLDEPAAGLGQQDRRQLGEVILKARDAGVSVVIVDHDMSFLLPLCDRLTVFDYGVKLAEGDPRVVCRDQRVIAAYLGSAFAERYAAASEPPEVS
jgi:ABC-type branched-subunit amino acid transport system ATPase component/ABC-type branched-subunit amino acid transport system permease subunit